MTQEPQTLEDSAAGEAGCSPQLSALPGSPPSGTRGPTRPPQVGERPPRQKWGAGCSGEARQKGLRIVGVRLGEADMLRTVKRIVAGPSGSFAHL